jgi:hypothetical protein
LRFRSVFSYLIVYRLGKKPVHVIAILHGKRDVAALLSFIDVEMQRNSPG